MTLKPITAVEHAVLYTEATLEAQVVKFYDAARAWPRNKMRVYRDPYEEAILVQWATQFGIRRAMRMAAIRLRAEGMTDAAERVDAKADAHVVAMNVLRDLLREGRAA